MGLLLGRLGGRPARVRRLAVRPHLCLRLGPRRVAQEHGRRPQGAVDPRRLPHDGRVPHQAPRDRGVRGQHDHDGLARQPHLDAPHGRAPRHDARHHLRRGDQGAPRLGGQRRRVQAHPREGPDARQGAPRDRRPARVCHRGRQVPRDGVALVADDVVDLRQRLVGRGRRPAPRRRRPPRPPRRPLVHVLRQGGGRRPAPLDRLAHGPHRPGERPDPAPLAVAGQARALLHRERRAHLEGRGLRRDRGHEGASLLALLSLSSSSRSSSRRAGTDSLFRPPRR